LTGVTTPILPCAKLTFRLSEAAGNTAKPAIVRFRVVR
jgi:hypothetical protein